MTFRWQWILMVLALALPFAARAQDKGEVVVYTALDRQYSEPILKLFEERTGIKVRPVFDAEAVKTVGLVNRLLAERNRPAADVFWNNEVLRSVQLAKEGLAEAYVSPAAADIPAGMKDAGGLWTGFAARARVIMVNTKMLPDEAEWPRRMEDILDPKWKGRAGFAKPLFGTTNTHAAAMFARDPEKALAFWTAAKANAVMLSGNATAADAVAAGELAWCFTDTDDAHSLMLDGKPVAMRYTEGGPEGEGAVLLPNTLVLVKGRPNGDNGKKLIDFLLTEEVEGLLAKARSAQIPVRASVPGPEKLPHLDPAKVLAPDWAKVYDSLARTQSELDKLVNQ